MGIRFTPPMNMCAAVAAVPMLLALALLVYYQQPRPQAATEVELRNMPAVFSVTDIDHLSRWELASAEMKTSIWQLMGWVSVSAVVIGILSVLIHWLLSVGIGAQRIAFLIFILCLALVGIGGRVFLAEKLPLVNDEQAYVYDALLYQPQTPYFWKSPLLISAQALWLKAVPLTSILWPRLLIIAAATAAFGLLSWCAYQLAGRAAGLGTLAVGLILPPVMAHSTLVLQEHFMLLPIVGVAALSFWVRRQARPAWWQLVALAALVSVATLVRHSAVFWLLAVAVWLRSVQLREWGRRVAWLLAPYGIAAAGFFLLFPSVVHQYRFRELFVHFFESSARQGWLNKAIRWREPLSQFMPLFLLTLLAIGRKQWWRGVLAIGLFTLGILTVFMPVITGEAGPDYPVRPGLVLVGATILMVISLVLPGGYQRKQWIDTLVFLLPPLLAYAIFDKVNAKYLAELLPGLVLLAGMGLGRLLSAFARREGQAVAAVALTVLLAWLVPWVPFMWEKPYAGTLSLSGVQAVVIYLRENTDPNVRIVTGSNLLPIMAGREPVFMIPHPAWYNPEWRGRIDPVFEQLFGPVADALEKGEIDIVINEKLTTDTYLRHPRIRQAIETNYAPVTEFANGNSAPIVVLELQK